MMVSRKSSEPKTLWQRSNGYEELLAEHEGAADRRRVAYQTALQKQAVRDRLADLGRQFYEIISPADPQGRGYKLEHLLRDLFELVDLDPKASFRVVREQIDGAFTFDKSDYRSRSRALKPTDGWAAYKRSKS